MRTMLDERATAVPTPLTSADESPDWTQITHDVLCPLCEYNLRGIRDPRCPECGYPFSWPEVLDPTRRLHPYLYEHHPERSFRSFVSTAVHGLLPKRFWTSLNPVQPSRPARLTRYWLICLMWYLAAAFAWSAITGGLEQQRAIAQSSSYYSMLITQYRQQLADPDLTADQRSSYQAALQGALAQQPNPGLVSLTQYSAQELIPLLLVSTTLFVWPWATLLTLMIFRWSMRRARVNPTHVRRCCLYSFDGLWWIGVLLIFSSVVGQGLIMLMIPVGAWKLVRAYQYYLRFDRPFLTVLASQIIVMLAAAQFWLTFNLWGLNHSVGRLLRSISP
jgi:hypothetical protein